MNEEEKNITEEIGDERAQERFIRQSKRIAFRNKLKYVGKYIIGGAIVGAGIGASGMYFIPKMFGKKDEAVTEDSENENA